MSEQKVIETVHKTANLTALARSRLGAELLRLLEKCELCDITLHVQQEKFSAHKNILCARSPVFNAMFKTDSKEKRTGIVNITDMEPDTAKKMLDFMYSDVVNLQTDSAIHLYSAADKYQIGLLKYECSSFLKSNLQLSNVLTVLNLAELHQDTELMKSAYDFIGTNATAIFKSEEWKDFVIQNGKIAVDVMQVVFVKKNMICSKKPVAETGRVCTYCRNPYRCYNCGR